MGQEKTARQHELDDVRLAQNGDVAAFERLYRRHLPRVHRTARWLLGTDDVDDAVQDAFVRAWDRLGTFSGRSSLGTWLDRVATNVVLRHREVRGRRAARELSLDAGAAETGAAESSAAGAGDLSFGAAAGRTDRPDVGVDIRLDLEAAVSTLPERALAVFVLHEIQGFTHEEIAEAMSTTVTTSRTQLHRARRLVRERLLRGGDEARATQAGAAHEEGGAAREDGATRSGEGGRGREEGREREAGRTP